MRIRPNTVTAAVAASVIALALGACGGEEESARETAPGTTAPTTTEAQTTTGDGTTGGTTTTEAPDGAGVPDGWTVCENDEEGYSIAYPEDWTTAQAQPRDRCRWFAREPFEPGRADDAPLTDLTVTATIGTFEQAAAQLQNPFGQRVLSRTGTEVAGVQAVRFETELARDFDHPEGTRTYGYVLNHGGTALRVETKDVPGRDLPYEENKEVLDRAVETIELESG